VFGLPILATSRITLADLMPFNRTLY